MKYFDPEYPIVIGLAGKGGTGKTSVANQLVPQSIIRQEGDIMWDHLYFAKPLYELVSIKQITKGELERDRQMYAIHEVLKDLFMESPLYGAPPYDQLVELVHEIQSIVLPRNQKPRQFLQNIGMLCREYMEDCFAARIQKTVFKQHAKYREEDLVYCAVVSDLRFENEAAMIRRNPNSILIRLDASEKVRRERIYDRGSDDFTPEQMNHVSERLSFPDEWVDYNIDTSDMDLQMVTHKVREAIFQTLDGLMDYTYPKEGINA